MSSSSDSDVDQQIILTPNVKKAIAKTLLSEVDVSVSDLQLGIKLHINVNQHVALKIPLTALVSYEDATITEVPVKEEREKVTAKAEEPVTKTPTSPAPKSPKPAVRQATVSVSSLPKADYRGKCDPYYKLYLDGTLFHGDRNLAHNNTFEGKWDLSIPNAKLQSTKTVKVEWYDKDRFSKDDLLGSCEFSAIPLRQNGLVDNLVVKGKATEKAGTKMKLVLNN